MIKRVNLLSFITKDEKDRNLIEEMIDAFADTTFPFMRTNFVGSQMASKSKNDTERENDELGMSPRLRITLAQFDKEISV